MKTLVALTIWTSFSLAAPIADAQLPRPIQPPTVERPRQVKKDEFLERLSDTFLRSEVVVLAKASRSKNQVVFTCTEVWKTKDGVPAVGQIVATEPKQKFQYQDGYALIYFPEFPGTKGWFYPLWFSEEKLRMCPDLSLTEIRNALTIKKD